MSEDVVWVPKWDFERKVWEASELPICYADCSPPEEICASREACVAMIAHRVATEAVAKARDAVVDAAKRQRMAWTGPHSHPALDYDDRVTATEEAARLLLDAECAEAEARARLEALK